MLGDRMVRVHVRHDCGAGYVVTVRLAEAHRLVTALSGVSRHITVTPAEPEDLDTRLERLR